MRRTVSCLSLALYLCSCGGDDGPTGGDEDAATSSCSDDSDCNADDLFCNGGGRCAPEDPDADATGCVPVDAPCGEGERCNEDTDACLMGGCDSDMDGTDSIACGGTDCDDEDPNAFPGNPEICDPMDRDEDCDPSTFGFRDGDADGVADDACCNVASDGTRNCGTDCDDAAPGTNPMSPEACDERDNDCDEAVDEGVIPTFYLDEDGDMWGRADMPVEVQACFRPEGYADNMEDCDDGNAAIHPSAVEQCDPGRVDENCDSVINPPALCMCEGTISRMCMMTSGVCLAGTEMCEDGEWAACSIMGTTEVCDGIEDEDCDGTVDEGLEITCFSDGDGDGFALVGTPMMDVCGVTGRPGVGGCPVGTTNRVPLGTEIDCNDTDSLIRPGGTEVCSDMALIDEDCDGTVDEGLRAPMCYADADNDGYAAAGATTTSRCSDPTRVMFGGCPINFTNQAPVGANIDCNDANNLASPGRTELCSTAGVDDDCDGSTDESGAGDASNYYRDMDMDGHGNPAMSTRACLEPSGYVAGNGDCDDSASGIHPGVTELCDGIDQNCNMSVDEGAADSCPSHPMTTYACTMGACEVATCPSNRDDCNGLPGDGCEVNLNTDMSNCGTCGTACEFECLSSCQELTRLTGGGQHTCGLYGSANRVACWGNNGNGQLGDGTMTRRLSPVDIGFGASIVDAGTAHTCARRASDGRPFCWGANAFGQLGNSNLIGQTIPTRVSTLTDVTDISAGALHSCAISAAGPGNAYCWGDNGAGQLGNGLFRAPTDPPTDHSPRLVSGLSNPVSLSAGFRHTCAVISGGAVRCWGDDQNGRLGDGSSTTGHATCGGFPITFDCALVPVAVSGISTATQVVAANLHSCALLSGGTVQCWGMRAGGRLGSGSSTGSATTPEGVTGISTATQIAAAGNHTCARLGSGQVVCWGVGGQGQLGNGGTSDSNVPVNVTGLGNAIAGGIAAGGDQGCAIRTDNSAWCWGENPNGSVGDGTTSRRLAPVRLDALP